MAFWAPHRFRARAAVLLALLAVSGKAQTTSDSALGANAEIVPSDFTAEHPVDGNLKSGNAESVTTDSSLYNSTFNVVVAHPDPLSSTYIPVDSPVYAMALRLYSLGYLDRAFISMRPWTRRSLLYMLQDSSQKILKDDNEEAEAILASLDAELEAESSAPGKSRGYVTGVSSAYTRLLGIHGQTLRDSFHLGQTFANDYGRPYEPGFNNTTGFSSVNELGRFSLFVRGEYQHAPSSNNGYSLALANTLSCQDNICPFAAPNAPQDTIPYGTIAASNRFRLQEATLSYHLLDHEISGGKTDAWIGPGLGGGMAWSNNAEDIYSFRINRAEPLSIPFVSRVLGPIRYDFMVGSLKGHTAPNSPWVHEEHFEIRPFPDFQIGLERTVIWGGKGHEPITLHTFLRSFFNFTDLESNFDQKYSAQDPGARFSAFNFSWRLPYIQHYVTLYSDFETHDDTTPLAAPRRSIFRPGVELAQVPGIRQLELRVEGADSDPPTSRSLGGQFQYYEAIQKQGYTNKGFLFGDPIGREGKGGQAWLTYHLSGNEWIQVEYMHKKTAKDFVPMGTTQNQVRVEVMKRLRRDVELDAWTQWERWKAPVYMPGTNDNFSVAGQITFYPKLHIDSARD